MSVPYPSVIPHAARRMEERRGRLNRKRRYQWARYAAFMLITAAGSLAMACTAAGTPRAGGEDAVVARGTELYAQNCAGCHGASGRDGVAPALNDPLFLQLVSDAQLRSIIDNGRPQYLMPAFGRNQSGPLSAQDIEAIVRAMRERWQPKSSPPGALPPYAETGAPAGNASRGAGLYAANCASCHGQAGAGGSGGAINARSYLQLTSDQELRRVIITGVPSRGMPAYDRVAPSPLTSTDVADLVAYVRSLATTGAIAAPSR